METTAHQEGPEWTERAPVWEECWASLSDPARAAVADAAGIGPGARVLDVGCGSGGFAALAAQRGARVAGVDAAAGMIEIARRRLPDADLRVGPMEQLPWPDGSFDLVAGFNAFQFAADLTAAVREAARVARPGGLVAICNWGARKEVFTVLDRLRELAPDEGGDEHVVRPLGEPGVLEDLARAAGLDPRPGAEVDVPFEVADQAALERAFLMDATGIEEGAARAAIVEAAGGFRRPDGSYRFENRFRYVIASRASGTASSSAA